MNKLKIIFKGGNEVILSLEDWTIETNAFGELVSIKWTGAKDEVPLFMDINEIVYLGEIKSED